MDRVGPGVGTSWGSESEGLRREDGVAWSQSGHLAGRLASGAAFIQGRAQGRGASPARGEDGCLQMGDPSPASKSPGTVVSAGAGGTYNPTHTSSS